MGEACYVDMYDTFWVTEKRSKVSVSEMLTLVDFFFFCPLISNLNEFEYYWSLNGLNEFIKYFFLISWRLSDKLFVFVNSKHLKSNNFTPKTLKALYILEV